VGFNDAKTRTKAKGKNIVAQTNYFENKQYVIIEYKYRLLAKQNI